MTTRTGILIENVTVDCQETQGTYAAGMVVLKIYEETQSFSWTANVGQRGGWAVAITDLLLNSRDLRRVKQRIIEEIHRKAKRVEASRRP